MDPRVKTCRKDLQMQHDLSYRCYEGQQMCIAAIKDLSETLKRFNEIKFKKVNLEILELKLKINNLLSPGSIKPDNLLGLNNTLGGLLNTLQSSDVSITDQCLGACYDTFIHEEGLMQEYQKIKKNPWYNFGRKNFKVPSSE